MRQALVAILLMIAATGAGIAAAGAVVNPAASFEQQPDALLPGAAELLVGARVPSSDGLPGWAVRTYVSRTGLLCAERGRLAAGVFGDLDEGGNLIPRGPGPTGTCGDTEADPVVAVVDRIAAYGRAPDETVVYGASSRAVRSAAVSRDAGAPISMAVGSRGSFIGVLAGLVSPRSLRLTLELADGERRVITWDPGGDVRTG
jgi:hypothetical protein